MNGLNPHRGWKWLSLVALAAAAGIAGLFAPAVLLAPTSVIIAAAWVLRLSKQPQPLVEDSGPMLRTLERQVRHGRRISIQDPTTALFQRWYFQLRVEEEVARCKRYGLPLALLRVVAASCPEEQDDADPVRVAQSLARELRAVDIAARWEGPDFLVCLPHADEKSAKAAASRLAGDASGCALSIGIVTYPIDGEESEALLEKCLSLPTSEGWPEGPVHDVA